MSEHEPAVPLLVAALRLVAEGGWDDRPNDLLIRHATMAAERYGIHPAPWAWWPEMTALPAADAAQLLDLAGGGRLATARSVPAGARGVPDLFLGLRAIRDQGWHWRQNGLLAADVAARAAGYGLPGELWWWWPAMTARSEADAGEFLARLDAERVTEDRLHHGRDEPMGASVPAGGGLLTDAPLTAAADLPGAAYSPPGRP